MNEGPMQPHDAEPFQGMDLALAYPWTKREGGNIRLMWSTDWGLTLEWFHIAYQFN